MDCKTIASTKLNAFYESRCLSQEDACKLVEVMKENFHELFASLHRSPGTGLTNVEDQRTWRIWYIQTLVTLVLVGLQALPAALFFLDGTQDWIAQYSSERYEELKYQFEAHTLQISHAHFLGFRQERMEPDIETFDRLVEQVSQAYIQRKPQILLNELIRLKNLQCRLLVILRGQVDAGQGCAFWHELGAILLGLQETQPDLVTPLFAKVSVLDLVAPNRMWEVRSRVSPPSAPKLTRLETQTSQDLWKLLTTRDRAIVLTKLQVLEVPDLSVFPEPERPHFLLAYLQSQGLLEVACFSKPLWLKLVYHANLFR